MPRMLGSTSVGPAVVIRAPRQIDQFHHRGDIQLFKNAGPVVIHRPGLMSR